ncbi:hypothetical protein [Sideroxydans sp.]|jgi:hypothetical protein
MSRKMMGLLAGILALSGCAMMGDGIPPEQLPNYGLVVSRISDHGRNMDTLPSSLRGFDNEAYVSWINGKAAFPARQMMNLLPGEYDIQVGLGCGNSATCRPSRIYKIRVEAGKRYILTPDAIYVSDRSVPRADANEKLYQY